MERSGRRGPRLAVLLPLSAAPQVLLGIAAASGSPRFTGVPGALYAALGVAAVTAGLLLRRVPGPAAVAVGVIELAALLIVPAPPAALLPLAAVVARAALRDARIWAAAVVGGVVLVPLVLLVAGADPGAWGRAVGASFLLVVAFGAGSFRRVRQQRAADRERIAVEQERVRIARELHDVLAHSLSSIAVQAGVGLHLAADRPEAATEALATIRDASRSALDEVRGVLGVLRGDERAPLAPEPDLAALPALVEQVRRSGTRIDLEDTAGTVPRPVGLALYRIVQESVTNTRRHAPGAAIEVRILREGGAIEARVRDRPGARPAEPHAGNGMIGMRERAAALGGSLAVLVHDDGLEVVAHIPEAP